MASRSADYAYHILDPAFITQYWHALLQGYASLFDWDAAERVTASRVCARPHRHKEINPSEAVCYRGPHGGCWFKLLGVSDDGFVPVPSPQQIATECNSTGSMRELYRRFTHVVPARFVGTSNVSDAAAAALKSWQQGSYRKAPR